MTFETSCTVRTEADHTIFVVGVHLDAVSADAFRRLVDTHARDGGSSSIRVDLSATQFMDSMGIGVLVRLIKHAQAKGAPMEITGAQAQPHSLLKLLKIDQVISVNC